MPEHRRRKSTKKFLADIMIFLTMIALTGHLSVNFWERFVLHSELTQMKSSLTTLKDTLFTIENAYENLQKELSDLADITEQEPDLFMSPGNRVPLYQDYLVPAVKPNVEQIVGVAPVTADEATSDHVQYQSGKVDKKAATAFDDADTITIREKIYRKYNNDLSDKDHAYVYVVDEGDRPTYKNTENVATVARYHLSGAGTDDLQCEKEECHAQRKILNIRKNMPHMPSDHHREHNDYNDPRNWKF